MKNVSGALRGISPLRDRAGLLLCALLFTLGAARLTAQSINVQFDEYGHASIWTNGAAPNVALPYTEAADPSGGLPGWPVLIYNLSFTNVAGDVLVKDPTMSGSPILDVLRFTGSGQLIVYSDNLTGSNSPADTPGPPDPFLANTLNVIKSYNGAVATAVWTPTATQVGYNPAFTQITFTFYDPGIAPVPEPGSNGLLAAGAGLFTLLAMARKRRRYASRGSGAAPPVSQENYKLSK